MKKLFQKYLIAWLVALIAFNAIAFLVPSAVPGVSKYSGGFWVSWAFIIAAFVGNLICAYLALQAKNRERLFLNLPLITLSRAGLWLMLIFGAAAMLLPVLPYWVGAVLCIVILAVTAIAVSKTSAAADTVEAVHEKTASETQFIKALRAEADILQSRAKSNEAKKACKAVSEALRYTDPRSSAALEGIEAKIRDQFTAFSKAVSDDSNELTKLAENLCALIEERARLCKLGK